MHRSLLLPPRHASARRPEPWTRSRCGSTAAPRSSWPAPPVLFTGDRAGWWYCDLVTVDDAADTVTIEDLYVDVLVGPPTAPYRVLDLDELAEAVSSGAVTVAQWGELPAQWRWIRT